MDNSLQEQTLAEQLEQRPYTANLPQYNGDESW
jgi:hypothetical protein